MTPLAITFMIIAVAVIWGGLVLSLVFLVRHPLPPEVVPEAGPGPSPGPSPGPTPGPTPSPRE